MTYQLVSSTLKNQNYRGHAEKCTWEFTVALPDQLGAGWTAQQIINAHIKELQKENSKLLELRIWEDTSPTWTTDYKVEVTASASPLFWNVIIIGVLAIVAILAIYFSITKIEDIVNYLGEKAPFALSMLSLTGLVLAAAGVVYLIKRPGGQHAA